MAQHGKLGEFENGKEDWKSYTECLAQYFKANNITDARIEAACSPDQLMWCENLPSHEGCPNP